MKLGLNARWLIANNRWLSALALSCIFAGSIFFYWPVPQDVLLRQAQKAFHAGRPAESLKLCQKILESYPDSVSAVLLAGRSAARLDRPQEAFAFLQWLPETGAQEIAEGWYLAGNLALQLGQASNAERAFRRALAISADHLPSNVKLAYLFGVEGRCWESVPFLLAAIRQQEFTMHHLVLLGASEPVIADAGLIDRCRHAAPDDPLPLIGLARTALKQNDPATAEAIARQVLKVAPRSIEAHATLGRILIASHPELIPAWQSNLPAGADDHPDVWSVRGEWQKQFGQIPCAIRCFWEAIRRDANHRTANYHLGQILSARNQPELAQAFVDRAEHLLNLALLIDRLYAQPETLTHFQQAAALTEALGRYWEAWGWSQLANRQSPHLKWAAENIARLETKLHADLPQTTPTSNPALKYDLSNYPLPEWSSPKSPSDQATALVSTRVPTFADVAAKSGLNFTYFSRLGSRAEEIKMSETTGGGVSVLDYDLNGFPDLYFTQGGQWPTEASGSKVGDQLFRNGGCSKLNCVTDAARLGDTDYSQGATSGDYNNDGFPDLYVANIGENKLYLNLGDGTFLDVSAQAGIQGQSWTTSCLIADLNRDSLPDLYDVNYLSAEAAATQICRQGEEIRWCSPDAFEAEQDHVYVNLGDGRFQNQTAVSGIVAPNGKGLGIVAADFDRSGRLSLFVANDAVANHFFVNETKQVTNTDSGVFQLKFVERAVPMGLAFDRDGLPQACMGVAAGDANGDGLIDLFVTNYADQSNTLYRQVPGLLFEDETRPAGLRDPGYATLGFGTQFLDAELDGWPDLIVTNGHVFDLSYKGVPYEMAPQYFRNLGEGRFSEITERELGSFFQRKSLGRGLARLDWNRDGREDFVVSHINSPAALVENQTSSAGHFLSLQLRGVHSARDAIGAEVRVVSKDRIWTRQLTGGDGYQASNEKKLIFGLGDRSNVDALEVRWPSGTSQIFRPVAIDRNLMLIEGHTDLIAIDTPDS